MSEQEVNEPGEKMDVEIEFVRHQQMNDSRYTVTGEDVDIALEQLRARILDNMNRHGHGTFINTAEFLGVVVEEFEELKAELVARNMTGSRREALDLAAAALFGWITFRLWNVEKMSEEIEEENAQRK